MRMKKRFAPFTRRITQRTVMWGLSGGFAMVLVLLGIAGLVAVRDSRAIRRSAGGLVQEQLLIARLLNEVQVEENTLTEVLHRLTRTPQTLDRSALLRELVEGESLPFRPPRRRLRSLWRPCISSAEGRGLPLMSCSVKIRGV